MLCRRCQLNFWRVWDSGFELLSFPSIGQRVLDISEDAAATVRCQKVQVDGGKSFMGDKSRVFNAINVS